MKPMSDKSSLRKSFKAFRKNLDEKVKAECDKEITLRLLSSTTYFSKKIILAYASTDDEVSTKNFVAAAFANGKKVAFPRCLDENGNMEFCYVNSVKELKKGAFGIFEPADRCLPVSNDDYKDCLCIVPGLAFDLSGYRLGYGKGYYDRFLSEFDGISIGVCYTPCVKFKLPHDENDKRVDFLVTEAYERAIK